MKVTFLPTSKAGKVSIGFGASFVVFWLILMGMAASGQKGGETILDNLWLGIPGILAGISVVVGFIISLVAIFKNKERSILVFLMTLIGLLATWFMLGELVVPH